MPVNPPKPEPSKSEQLGKAVSRHADIVFFYLGLITGIALFAAFVTLGLR